MEQKGKHLICSTAQRAQTMSFTNPLVPAGSHQPPHFLCSFQMFGIIKFPSLFKMVCFHQQSHGLLSPTVYWQEVRTWKIQTLKKFYTETWN